MHRVIPRAATVALVAGLLLGAFTASTGPDGAGSPPDLTGYLTQEVRWRDCPDSDEYLEEIPDQALCAQVSVPVDYFGAAPGRGDLDIALIKIPATGQSRGSILVNPGGPGGSGFDQVATYAEDLARNLPGYDIVGFDPRGVSRSAGFDCDQAKDVRLDYIEQDFTPEDAAEFEETYRRSQDYDRACREANPAWGFIGTPSVARDVHVISRALGDQRINFYGVSYGSVIGYELLREFPDEIGRMILESPVDPAVEQGVAEQAAAFNAKIEELLVACASPEYLYCGNGRSVEEVRTAFIEAGHNIEDPDVGTLTDNGRPSESLAYYGMVLPLYLEWNDQWTKRYLDAVHALINNNDASSFEYWGYLYQGYNNVEHKFFVSDDIQGVVLCLDESKPVQDTDIAAERRKDEAERSSIQENAPLLYAVGFSDGYTADDRAYEPCSYAQEAFADPAIPDPLPKAAPVTNPGATPVLVLGVTGDTATPYAWSQSVAGALGMPLVTQDTTGHGVYVDSDNQCTQGIVASYLESGALPSDPTTC